jgi:hypothetical protein
VCMRGAKLLGIDSLKRSFCAVELGIEDQFVLFLKIGVGSVEVFALLE